MSASDWRLAAPEKNRQRPESIKKQTALARSARNDSSPIFFEGLCVATCLRVSPRRSLTQRKESPCTDS